MPGAGTYSWNWGAGGGTVPSLQGVISGDTTYNWSWGAAPSV
jgi:hypothetical protein